GQAAAPPQPSQEDLEEEAWEIRELVATKLAAVYREEQEMKEREQRLAVERVEYLKTFAVIDAEDKVEFGPMRLLRQRYQLIRLLGKSIGQSWAYRAFDLHTLQNVMLRVHENLKAPQGGQECFESAAQECEVAKTLRHPCMASLVDHFVHDGGSYVTVWEFCEGDLLEAYLRRTGTASEKEAKGIALQLLSALRYLESKGHVLDRQDLRSSRIAIRGGEVKICGLTLPSFRRGGSSSSSSGRASSQTAEALHRARPVE
ncbi:unnamed protein product, partial [Polarella glacialis]